MPGSSDTDRIIGALQESTRESKAQREKLFTEISGIKNSISKLEVCHSRMRASIGGIETDIEDMLPVLNDYKKTKQRGIGVIVGAGVGGGGIGAALTSWLKGLL